MKRRAERIKKVKVRYKENKKEKERMWKKEMCKGMDKGRKQPKNARK